MNLGYRPYTSRTISLSISSTTAGVNSDLVYRVPDRHEAEITFFSLCNAGNASKNISVQIRDNGTYNYLVKNRSVPGNTSLPLIESSRIFLKAGDEIRAYKEGSDEFFVCLSAKQYYRGIIA